MYKKSSVLEFVSKITVVAIFSLGLSLDAWAARTQFSQTTLDEYVEFTDSNNLIQGGKSLVEQTDLNFYEVLKDVEISVKSASGFNNEPFLSGGTLHLSAGLILTFFEERWSLQDGVVVEVGLDGQIDSLPSVIVIQKSEWNKIKKALIDINGDTVRYDKEGNLHFMSQVSSQYAKLQNNCHLDKKEFQSNSVYVWPTACNKYDYTKRKNGTISKSTLCFSFVKWYLLKKGLISEYFVSNRAKDGHYGLWNNKFKKWKFGNKKPIRNLVCVYTGGRSGHIEVWVEETVRNKKGQLVKKAGWFWGPYTKDRRSEKDGKPEKNILFKRPMNHSSRFGRSRPLRSCWYKGAEAEADKARIYKKIRAQKAARRAKRLAKLKKSGKAVKASAQVATPIEFKVVKHDPSVPRACRSKHRLPSVTPAEATVVICYNGPREYKGRKSVICGYGKGPKNDKDRRIAKKQARENRYRALKKWQAEVDCGLIKTDNLEVPKPLGR